MSYSYFYSEEVSKAEGRLSLYQASVQSELERFSHLTYVLARDPFVIATAEGGTTAQLNQRLRAFAAQAGLDAIYLMGRDGITIAASNAGQMGSFVGQDYSFRPYFQTAMKGQQGRFYGIGATTGLPGYFIADPVRDEAGETVGVIALKIDMTKLQDSWRNSGEQVLLANSDGVVQLTSDPAWLYRALRPLTPQQRSVIEISRQFPGQDLAPLDWKLVEKGRAIIGGEERIHLTTSGLPHGWELHYFASGDRAIAVSWLVTAAFVILGGTALVFYQIQRTRRTAAALRRSEEEEVQLRRANEQLAREIEDRRTAERRLKRTQDELERAGRLAALGQLSASVTHELGQPIAAMRNHIAAAEIGNAGETGLSSKIGALVDRMEGITRQLKFFARTGDEGFTEVDLGAAMATSLDLVAPNISSADASVDFQQPDKPVIIRGSRLRIEQVMTNLIRNAVDAVEDSELRQVRVRIGEEAGAAWIEIADSGHGLGSATLTDLQEPFVTSRESGQGMGLGLAISANIVQDHDGKMSACNSDLGGAMFRVEFPTMAAEESENR